MMHISLFLSTLKRLRLPILNPKYYFILRESKHFYRLIILTIVFTILEAAFQGFGVGFILALLQGMIDPNSEPVKTGLNWFDVGILDINGTTQERIYRVFILILVTVLLRLSFYFLGRFYSLSCRFRLSYQLRLRCFEQLQALRLDYFTDSRSGDFIHTITSEINYLTMSLASITELFTAGCTICAYIVSMFLLSWQLALMSIMLILLQAVGVTMMLGKVREASFKKSKAGSQYTSTILEFIHGIRTVHAFAAQEFEDQRHSKVNLHYYQALNQAKIFIAAIGPLSEAVVTILFIGMLALATTILISTGQLQLASLLTFMFVLFRLLPIMRQINHHRTHIGDLYGSIKKIKELLRTDNKLYFYNGNIPFSRLKQAIEFVKVDFGYNPRQSVLHEIHSCLKRNNDSVSGSFWFWKNNNSRSVISIL